MPVMSFFGDKEGCYFLITCQVLIFRVYFVQGKCSICDGLTTYPIVIRLGEPWTRIFDHKLFDKVDGEPRCLGEFNIWVIISFLIAFGEEIYGLRLVNGSEKDVATLQMMKIGQG